MSSIRDYSNDRLILAYCIAVQDNNLRNRKRIVREALSRDYGALAGRLHRVDEHVRSIK